MAFDTTADQSCPEPGPYVPRESPNAAQLSFGIARLLRDGCECVDRQSVAAAPGPRMEPSSAHTASLNLPAVSPSSAFSSSAVLPSSFSLSWEATAVTPPSEHSRRSAFIPVVSRRRRGVAGIPGGPLPFPAAVTAVTAVRTPAGWVGSKIPAHVTTSGGKP